ncbi:MAG: hypothetical protein QM484_14445 [Woeseiaceae bacterium]
MSIQTEYYAALDRLMKNKPQIVPKGTKITKDSVALEAGRKKGSIKKSRESFWLLIKAIEQEAHAQTKPIRTDKEKIIKAKEKYNHYRTLYEDSLAREVMLIKRVYELEMTISKLRASDK